MRGRACLIADARPRCRPQEAEAAQEAFVRLRREHESLQNAHKVGTPLAPPRPHPDPRPGRFSARGACAPALAAACVPWLPARAVRC
jgi:hypothetical protein